MIVIRNDYIGFVVNRKIFCFSDHSFEKLYRQNNDRDIVNLSKIFIEKHPHLVPHQIFFWFRTKHYWSKKKFSDVIVRIVFCFEKKMVIYVISTKNVSLRSFYLQHKHLFIILNMTKYFFLNFRNKKQFELSHLRICSLINIVLFWIKKHFFMRI